jgi:hypothetical protein
MINFFAASFFSGANEIRGGDFMPAKKKAKGGKNGKPKSPPFPVPPPKS